MRNTQTVGHASLNAIIGWLKEGRFVVPDVQRGFEWKPRDIADLTRSIVQDEYIGSLLLWKGKKENFDALACEPIYGCGGSDERRKHIVLDGQQRLTAMYYAFIAPDVPLPGRKNRYLYFIRIDRFSAAEGEDAFVYDRTKDGPKLLNDRPAQYEQHMFPVAILGEGTWELMKWVVGYCVYWDQKRDAAVAAGDEEAAAHAARSMEIARSFGVHISAAMQECQVPYVELDRDVEVRWQPRRGRGHPQVAERGRAAAGRWA